MRRLQLSLVMVLTLTLLAAVFFSVAFALPEPLGYLALAAIIGAIVTPAVFVAAWYGQGDVRAFCLGAICWFGLLWWQDSAVLKLTALDNLWSNLSGAGVFGGLSAGTLYVDFPMAVKMLLGHLFMLGLSGVTAVVVRRFVEPQPKPAEESPADQARHRRFPPWLIVMVLLLMILFGILVGLEAKHPVIGPWLGGSNGQFFSPNPQPLY